MPDRDRDTVDHPPHVEAIIILFKLFGLFTLIVGGSMLINISDWATTIGGLVCFVYAVYLAADWFVLPGIKFIMEQLK